MKKRVFYVINLDRGRILMMSVLIIGFLLISFATGYRFGVSGSPDQHASRESHNEAFMDPARQGLDRSLGTNDLDSPKLASPSDLTTLPEVDKTQANSQTKPEGRRTEQKEKVATREPRETRPATLSEKRPAKPEKNQKPVKPTRTEKANRHENRSEKESRVEKPAKTETSAAKPEKARNTEKQVARPQKPETKPNKVQNSEKNRKPQPGESARLEPTGTMRLANVPSPKPSTSLQLGTFTSRDAANRMSDQLKKQGFDSGLVQTNGKFSVRVGKSTDDADLKRLEEKLRQKNYSPIRVRIP